MAAKKRTIKRRRKLTEAQKRAGFGGKRAMGRLQKKRKPVARKRRERRVAVSPPRLRRRAATKRRRVTQKKKLASYFPKFAVAGLPLSGDLTHGGTRKRKLAAALGYKVR